MVDSNTSREGSNDSTEADTDFSFSRRSVLAATGLAGLGAASSTAVGTQDDGDETDDSGPPFAVKEHDHSGAYDTASHLGTERPVDSITVDTLTSAHHNSVVYASEFDTLNEAIDSVDEGPAHVVLPDEVTEFDEPIENVDHDLTISGQGMDASTIRSTSPGVLYRQHDDASNRTLVLQGFTLDLDHVPSDRVIYAEDDFGRLRVDDFRMRNVNLEGQETRRGFFEFLGHTELVRIDDSEFRFDTIVNRHEHKYRVFQNGGVPSEVERFYARRNNHVGERIVYREDRPDLMDYNGYRVSPTEYLLIEGCNFRKWDQYATFILARDGASVNIINNQVTEAGDGDILRAGSYQGGAHIQIRGNTVLGPTAGAGSPSGDRGIIIQNSSAEDSQARSVTIENNIVKNELVAISVTSGRNVQISNNNISANGHVTELTDGSRSAILVRSRRHPTTDLRVAGNVITSKTDARRLGPAIWVREGNVDWEAGYAIVENNMIFGNDTNPDEWDTEDALLLDVDNEDVKIIERDNEVYSEDEDDENDEGDDEDEPEEEAEVAIREPTTENPVEVAPNEEFDIVWETDQPGAYRLQYHVPEDDDWDNNFPPESESSDSVDEAGTYTRTVENPFDESGAYHIRLIFDNAADDRSRDIHGESFVVTEGG